MLLHASISRGSVIRLRSMRSGLLPIQITRKDSRQVIVSYCRVFLIASPNSYTQTSQYIPHRNGVKV
eukprot:scaffold243_cov265-Alexandrium_tamarense.AAC.1